MSKPKIPGTETTFNRTQIWRDLVLLIVAILFVGWLSIHFNFGERVFVWTQSKESFQLDELLGVMLFTMIGMTWFVWRRYSETKAALVQKRIIEEKLAHALDDNRRLAQQYVEIQEAERRSLARELHDEMGQYLNVIKIDAISVRQYAGQQLEGLRDAAMAIIHNTDHVHKVVSGLIRRLRPVGLDELGLKAALEHCVNTWSSRFPQTEFMLTVDENLNRLGETMALTLYRLVQEGLTNASKYADAKEIKIYLAKHTGTGNSPDELVLTIADDGVGADLTKPKNGLGLIGMRERVESLGGQFLVSAAPGKGFCITACLPVSCR